MGLSSDCLRIFEDKENQRYSEIQRERERQYQKYLELRKNAFEFEFKRTDIKTLDNVEKLEHRDFELYKPKPPIKRKFFLEKNSFMAGNDNIIEIKVNNNFDYSVIKVEKDKYGLLFKSDSKKKFLDVYDCLTQNFLYRLKDINGENIKSVILLLDGTHLVKTKNNSYIIKIIENKGYQVLYNIVLNGFLNFLYDERILSTEYLKEKKSTLIEVFEKDNNGIYKKIAHQNLGTDIYSCEQVNDNIIAFKDNDYIYFFEISSMKFVEKFYNPRGFSILVFLKENLLLTSALCNELNTFNLIDFEFKKIVNYYLEGEEKYIEHPEEKSIIPENILHAMYLPNGFILLKMCQVPGNYYYHLVRWDEEKNRLIFRDNKNLSIVILNLIKYGEISYLNVFEEYNMLLVDICDKNDKNKYYLYFR